MKVGIEIIRGNKIKPMYATVGSAGFDLTVTAFKQLYSGNKKIDLSEKMNKSISDGKITLRPNERVLIGSGIKVQLPIGYELQIRDRSGISLKRGIKVFNAPGTIDSDYRGEIGVILVNLTSNLAEIKLGEKIAQAVICKYEQAEFIDWKEEDITERGNNGFGSTGNYYEDNFEYKGKNKFSKKKHMISKYDNGIKNW